MKSQIVIKSLLTLLLVITFSHNAKAQVILNPGEWLALAEGNELINSQSNLKRNHSCRQQHCKTQWRQSSIR